jgi:hypothetical protein
LAGLLLPAMVYTTAFSVRVLMPGLQRYHGWFLALAWLAMQLCCWRYYHGPRLFGDGIGYLAYARYLAGADAAQSGDYLRYIGYAAFLSVFVRLKLGLLGIGLAQVALSGLAARAFYVTAWRLGGQHWPTAALATAAFIGWFEVQAFNAFLLTESLFTSLLILSLWAIVRARDAWGIVLVVSLLLLMSFVRPNGFIALVAAALAGAVGLWQAGQKRTLAWVGLPLLLLLPFAWARVNWLLGTIDIMHACAAGTVIFNYPPAALSPPADLHMPALAATPLMQIVEFITHNFRYFSQLAALRLVYFLGFPKPWHSVCHLLWIVTTLPFIYWRAACGIAHSTVPLPVRTYLAACLLLQMGVVMLTFEDWDVRFSGPFIPYWLLLAALGSQPFLHRLLRR